MSTSRRLLAVSAGLLAITTALVLTLVLQDHTPSRRLPNGEVIRLQAVTYGTQHQWTPLPAWKRLLEPVLPPPSAADVYHVSFYPPSNHKPYLVVWTTRSARSAGIQHGPRAFAVDEEGREYAPAHSLWTMKAGGPVVEYYSIPVPRRGRSVTLRFYGRAPQVAAEFSIPLPAAALQDRLAAPPPTALSSTRACPIVATAGDLQVTLERIRTNVFIDQRRFGGNRELLSEVVRPAANGERRWSTVAMRVTRNGKPAPDWTPQFVALTDTEGHRVGTGPCFKYQGREYAEVPGFLSDGPVGVHATLARMGARIYRPDDSWTIPRVAVPGRGKETSLNRSATRHGVHVSVSSLAGAGTPVAGGLRNGVEAVPYLRLRATGSPGAYFVTVWATDDQGHRYDTDLPAYRVNMSGRDLRIRLHLSRDVRRVDLHFAVHSGFETRNVEFTALPSATAD